MSNAASRLARRIVIALGLLIALVGLTLDFLLPGSSPGISLPQLLVVLAGLLVAALPFLRRRWRGSQPIQRRYRGLLALLIALATLLILEFALTLSGIPTYFPTTPPERDVQHVLYRKCGEFGCLLQPEHFPCRQAPDVSRDSSCIVNSLGFRDDDEFVADDSRAQRHRILMLGDSFAYGYSADIGKSYVETVEAGLESALVWNLGVAATGTNQDLAAFERFAPLLRPRLTILGFYENDFADNVKPVGNWGATLMDADGKLYVVEDFREDRFGNPVDLPLDEVYAYLAAGYNPPTSELERVIGQTRLGGLALRALDLATKSYGKGSVEQQIRATREYLARLRDAAEAIDSDFLVMLIPRPEDLGTSRSMWDSAILLVEELRIPYLNTLPLLNLQEDYAPPPDGHWNNAGHQKIGAVLLDCVESYFALGSLDACEHVIQPRGG